MDESALKFKLNEYKMLRQKMAELQNHLEQVEDSIKSFLGDQEEWTVDGIQVKWTRYIARRFDVSAFKKEHAAIYEQYVRQMESRRFSVT